MSNPYLLERPALISVSGGRTSGFMLRQIIDAFGGTLPEDVIPVFCNTGREHEATLRFLHEIEMRWARIIWLEYRHNTAQYPVHTYEIVDFCGASRNGEPFSQLMSAKQMLPNPLTRFCTSELKVRTGNRFARQGKLWEAWARAVGLRYDEPRRVANLVGESRESVCCPMHKARHTLADVTAFWQTQDFDLQLPGNDRAFGNCDLCFLKARRHIEKVMRTTPKAASWWIEQEERDDLCANGYGRWFRTDRPTYRQMLTQLTVQGQMFDDAIEDDTLPCNCTD